MNKKYIVLLSSLIACSSWGMENISEHERIRYSDGVSSLLEMSADMVQKNIHQAVKKDLIFLRDSVKLTPQNVEKNIKNEIALLEVGDALQDCVFNAYIKSHRWLNIPKAEAVIHGGYGRENEENEWVVYFKPNSDASEIAEIVWKGDRNERYLYIWRENAEGWCKTLQSKVDATAEDMVWDSDDYVLLVASNEGITILNRTPENPRFTVSQQVKIAPFRLRKDAFGLTGYSQPVSERIDDIAKVFGRLAWDAEKKHLAVETKRDMATMQSHLTIVALDDNNAVSNMQEIKIPIADEYGINSVEFNENGLLSLVRVAQEKIKVARWHLNGDKYEPLEESAIDSDVVLALAEGTYPAEFTRLSADNLLSNGQFTGIVEEVVKYVRFPGMNNERIMTAVRRNPNVGLRHVGFIQESKDSQSGFGFLIHNELINLRTIARYICRCYENPFQYLIEQKNEDSIL